MSQAPLPACRPCGETACRGCGVAHAGMPACRGRGVAHAGQGGACTRMPACLSAVHEFRTPTVVCCSVYFPFSGGSLSGGLSPEASGTLATRNLPMRPASIWPSPPRRWTAHAHRRGAGLRGDPHDAKELLADRCESIRLESTFMLELLSTGYKSHAPLPSQNVSTCHTNSTLACRLGCSLAVHMHLWYSPH